MKLRLQKSLWAKAKASAANCQPPIPTTEWVDRACAAHNRIVSKADGAVGPGPATTVDLNTLHFPDVVRACIRIELAKEQL